MIITIDKLELVKSLESVKVAAKKANGLEILTCVLIKAEKGKVAEFITQNLEQCVIYRANADVSESGQALVDCRRLLDYCKRLPNVKIKLECKENKLTVDGKICKATFSCVDTENYPEIPDIEKIKSGQSAEISGKDIERLVSLSEFTAKDASHPSFCGVQVDGGKAVGIDGYKMAEAEVSTNVSGILPTEFVKFLGLLELEEIDTATMYWTKSMASASTETMTIISRLIEGNIEIDRIEEAIPRKWHKVEVSVNAADFSNALDIALSVSGKDKRIKIWLTEDGMLAVSSETNVSSAETKIEAKAENASEFTGVISAWNGQWLKSLLRLCKPDDASDDEMNLELDYNPGEPQPLMIENNGFTTILMPINIG